MDYFDRTKRSMLEKLYKPDKSRKGDIDPDAELVIRELNKKQDYYTTSSCGGRISLFFEALSKKKKDSGWLFVKHQTVSADEIMECLKSPPNETVWLRQESPIFHVACRNMESAVRLLDISRELGFKRAGIIGHGRRTMVEIIFNNKMDVPVSADGSVFVDKKFVRFLVKKANSKHKENLKLLSRFVKKIKKEL